VALNIDLNQNNFDNSLNKILPNFPAENKSSIFSRKVTPFDEFIKQKPNLQNAVIYKKEGSTFVTEAISEKTDQELKKAFLDNNLAIIEKYNGQLVVKLVGQDQTQKFKSLGIQSIILQGSNGPQTYHSFNFETLSEDELSELVNHIQSYINFLNVHGENDHKSEHLVSKLEIKLSYLKLAKSFKQNGTEKTKAMEMFLEKNISKTAIKVINLIISDRIREFKAEEVEKTALEKKHFFEKKDILKEEIRFNELKKSISSESVLTHSTDGENIVETKGKTLVNIGRFITLGNDENK
jgi:hypothetical protein